jgi:hypothetical protein
MNYEYPFRADETELALAAAQSQDRKLTGTREQSLVLTEDRLVVVGASGYLSVPNDAIREWRLEQHDPELSTSGIVGASLAGLFGVLTVIGPSELDILGTVIPLRFVFLTIGLLGMAIAVISYLTRDPPYEELRLTTYETTYRFRSENIGELNALIATHSSVPCSPLSPHARD